MLAKIIDFSIRQRVLVLLATLALVGIGIYSFTKLPIDAVPDITNVQVQINTNVPALSPVEIEQQVGIAMAGGGLLVENLDELGLDRGQLQVVTKRRPTLEELTDLLFAWRAVRHVRSNAIVLARNAATVGVGASTSLSATLTDANGATLTGRAVAWSTSYAGKATVSNGVVTGVAFGQVTITASSEGKDSGASRCRAMAVSASIGK